MRIEEVPGPPPTALVANLPYNVSVPVLIHLLTLLPSLERGLVMVQAEVADRLAAGPGSKTYGVPSVKAAWFADVRRAGAIGRNVFWPAPNVDSGLVAWTRRDPPRHDGHPPGGLRASSTPPSPSAASRSAPRCAGWPGSAEVATAALESAGVDPTARGEVLTVEDFARIAEGLAAARTAVSITVRAAAKINLHLGVGRVRDDGFHPLDTVYQAIGIHDDLSLAAADDLTLTTRVADHIDPDDVPDGPDNIVLRAARLLAERGRSDGDRRLRGPQGHPGRGRHGGRLGRRAPPRSSRCDRLWGLDTSDDDLLALAAELGSDIPFSLVGGTARGVGRGELVTPVDDRGAWWWVAVPGRSRPVDAGGLPPLRRAPPRRPGGARRRPSRCSRRWPPASPYASRGRCTTTCRSRRSTCVPSSAT